uniref:Cyclin n=1 Tax=Paramoeba aestuarina TaxID=180227 RepID=A0A7S4PH37_9EUKA|mmetsp:Transcript_6261/g.9479  ORF Transcript_6261/g.9479 Transcript_6261/m.9479 type:complete len:188 (+) Transcript_6261:39-602(+)
MQLQTLPCSSLEEFIDALTTELGELIAFGAGETSRRETKFHALRAPIISLRQYVERVTTYAPCTVECFVVALVYLNRMSSQKLGFINPMTIHRLFLASLLLAAKYYDDLYFNNKFYARVGGISCKELNALELEFLIRTEFSLGISKEEFLKFSHVLSSSPCHSKTASDPFFSVSPVTARPFFDTKAS